MVDMTKTVAPKSDQLNYDDFIGGKTMTITITGIKGNDSAEQPISLSFKGDNGKPFKPCKSMRRVLIAAWKADGNAYIGRSMTLYGDPTVVFGGVKVGGIRISHMSDIKEALTISLTASKTVRKPYTVKPLAGVAPTPTQATPPAPEPEAPQHKYTVKTSKNSYGFDDVRGWQDKTVEIVGLLSNEAMIANFLNMNANFADVHDTDKAAYENVMAAITSRKQSIVEVAAE
jgi:hypothetical protein